MRIQYVLGSMFFCGGGLLLLSYHETLPTHPAMQTFAGIAALVIVYSGLAFFVKAMSPGIPENQG